MLSTVVILVSSVYSLHAMTSGSPLASYKIYDDMWLRDIALSPDGSLLLCGWNLDGTPTTMVTKKYSEEKEQCWAREYVGGIGQFSCPDKIGVADDGAVYVAGRIRVRAKHGLDEAVLARALLKYSKSGREEWVSLWQRPQVVVLQAEQIAVGSHTVCILGRCYVDRTYASFQQMLLYDVTGKELRVMSFEKNDQGISRTAHPILDGNDCLYYAQYTVTEKDDRTEEALVKAGYNGSVQWRLSTHEHEFLPTCMTCFAWYNDALYLSGFDSENRDWSDTYVTVKLDPSGNAIWKDSVACDGKIGQPHEIIVDEAGAVYVAGWAFSNCGHLTSSPTEERNTNSRAKPFFQLTKYDRLGNRLWFSTLEMGEQFALLQSIGLRVSTGSQITYFCLVEADEEVARIHAIRSTDSGKFMWNKELGSISECLEALQP